MEGIITLINKKYVILNDKHFINEKELLFTLLPNDIVSYYIKNNQIIINNIIYREEQVHIGIVKNVVNDQLNIVFPALPNYINIQINNLFEYKLNIFSVVIVKFSINTINIVDHYDSIKNRTNDKQLFLKLYQEKSKLCSITPKYKDSKCHYSDDFKDLTHLYTFNVDPTGSKDFDDAISVDDKENKLYVHIVDANEQICKLSTDDIDSFKSSFTLYLPEHIQNILPKVLAENNLSLIEGEERKTITVEFNIDPITQNINSHSIYRSIIKIKKRYDYEIFNNELHKFPKLISFYEKWKKNTLIIPHVKFNIDNSSGKLLNYNLEYNHDTAHKIIETMMILTNLTISEHVGNLIPQRYHCKIKIDLELQKYTNNDLIDSILTIKKYKPAIYDSTNCGHFGLGLNSYTHFTSPIRRYFDVIVHRLLAGTTYENIEEILNHINNQERFIDKIVDSYNNLKILTFFEENINKIWSGFILSITKNGLTVIIEENLYELFIFENKKQFNLYDKLNVKIKNINWFNLSVSATIV